MQKLETDSTRLKQVQYTQHDTVYYVEVDRCKLERKEYTIKHHISYVHYCLLRALLT